MSPFITISGIDGSGKSTQSTLLAEKLRSLSYDVSVVKTYGEKEKKALQPIIEGWGDISTTLLFQALHHEKARIIKNLKDQGIIPISERWREAFEFHHQREGYLSSRPALRDELAEMSFCGICPDIGVMIDIPAGLALERTAKRGRDKFDEQPLQYFEEMRRFFLNHAITSSWHIVDGLMAVEDIHDDIKNYVLGIISE